MRASQSVTITFAMIAVSVTANADTRYCVRDLGPGRAYAINDARQIVGFASVGGNRVPCIYDPNGCNEPLLLGGLAPDCVYGEALDINEAGQIVGWAYSAGSPCDLAHAVLFDETGGGANVDLGTLGGATSYAYAINNAGQVIGDAQTAASGFRPTVFDVAGGNWSLSGDQGGGASDVSDVGLVVGTYAPDSHSFSKAAVWDLAGGPVVDLGPAGPPWERSRAEGVNASGQIVGWSYHRGQYVDYAILFGSSPDDYTVIGPYSSHAYAINDQGVAVGERLAAGDGAGGLMFVQDAGGWQAIDLGDPNQPVWMQTVYDINNEGWIVGRGYDGSNRAVLLKPAPPGDLDYDCEIGFDDLNILLAHYGTTSGATYDDGDLDEDGDVDFDDLNLLLAVYGSVCP